MRLAESIDRMCHQLTKMSWIGQTVTASAVAPDTLRANYGRPQEDGTLAGQAGDCFFQFVEWDKDGQLNAWAMNQFGSSPGNPGSLHHTDQAPLFAEEKLRKVPFTREEVLAKAKRTYRP